MKTIFKWTISACDVILGEGTMQNVITTIHWRYNAENDGVNAETYGAAAMGEPVLEDFTDYDNITEAQMISWLEDVIDMETMNNSLNAQIQLLKNPITATLQPAFLNN